MLYAGVAELAYAADSKSAVREGMRVRLPSPALSALEGLIVAIFDEGDGPDYGQCLLCSAAVQHDFCRPEAIDPAYGVELTMFQEVLDG